MGAADIREGMEGMMADIEDRYVEEVIERYLERRSWITSRSLLKRAFAVYGHSMLAGIIMAVVFVILSLLFGGVSSGGFF